MRLADQAEAIRAELARLGRRGRGIAYPEGLRERAVSYYCARRAPGAAQRDIGLELGLPWQTLHKWASDACDADLVTASTPGFERVEIIEALEPARRSSFVVRGPAGLCIEGLDLDALVELVRRLS